MYETESSRWQAIQARDHAAASFFVYAVISTKIYCRPGCPSRLARRANVCFYDTAEQAAAAGYRACLRCKPDQSGSESEGQQGRRDAVKRACEYIAKTKGQAKFPDVAKHVGLSTRYLYGLFRSVTGTTPAKYGAQFRPEGNVSTSSETLSAVSKALSPALGDGPKPLLDPFAWSAVMDFNADTAAFLENLALPLGSDTVISDYTIGAMAVSKFPMTEDFQNLMPYEHINSVEPDLDLQMLDLVWDMYH